MRACSLSIPSWTLQDNALKDSSRKQATTIVRHILGQMPDCCVHGSRRLGNVGGYYRGLNGNGSRSRRVAENINGNVTWHFENRPSFLTSYKDEKKMATTENVESRCSPSANHFPHHMLR